MTKPLERWMKDNWLLNGKPQNCAQSAPSPFEIERQQCAMQWMARHTGREAIYVDHEPKCCTDWTIYKNPRTPFPVRIDEFRPRNETMSSQPDLWFPKKKWVKIINTELHTKFPSYVVILLRDECLYEIRPVEYRPIWRTWQESKMGRNGPVKSGEGEPGIHIEWNLLVKLGHLSDYYF